MGNMKAPRQRFKVLKFVNPRTGTTSWRVSGIRRNGERIRENYADPQEAQLRYTELEGEYHAANGTAALRAIRPRTRITSTWCTGWTRCAAS